MAYLEKKAQDIPLMIHANSAKTKSYKVLSPHTYTWGRKGQRRTCAALKNLNEILKLS